MSELKGPQVTTAVFGGVFHVDGAGHYPGLELINFIVSGESGLLPGPDVAPVHLRRVTQDFARRLVAEAEKMDEAERRNVLLDRNTEIAVAHLLRCVELEIPNLSKAKAKSWERTHFFPYTRSLVHWDARRPRAGTRGPPSIERRYYRGGGAYAFSVLRRDPDLVRLQATRDGFGALYPESSAALERLSAALRRSGVIDEKPVADEIEFATKMFEDCWEELYRTGIRNILSHRTSTSVRRIRAVINWTGIWLVLLEAARSAAFCDRTWVGLVIDCAGIHPQLRRASQKCLKDHQAGIAEAAHRYADQNGLKRIKNQQMNQIRGFFSNTAAICGLLNAGKGRRHCVLKIPAIEALVLAGIAAEQEMPFEEFVSVWLGERCGLIIGRDSAERAGLLDDFDASIFEENERQFAEQMRTTGMLRVYSDATRMVSSEVLQ